MPSWLRMMSELDGAAMSSKDKSVWRARRLTAKTAIFSCLDLGGMKSMKGNTGAWLDVFRVSSVSREVKGRPSLTKF